MQGHTEPAWGGAGWILKGNHHYHEKNYEKALEFYQKALEGEQLPQAQWNIHNRLCATYTKLGDHEKALEEANEMIRCDPEHPKGFVRKGGAHYFLGDFDGALEEYKRAQQHMHNGKADAKLLSNFPQYVSTVESKKQ